MENNTKIEIEFPLTAGFSDYHEADYVEGLLAKILGKRAKATELNVNGLTPSTHYQFKFGVINEGG